MTRSRCGDRWTILRCSLPCAARGTNTFLAGFLGPVMIGLVETHGIDDWYFIRSGPDLWVFAAGADSAMLHARVTGLLCAAQALRCPGGGGEAAVALMTETRGTPPPGLGGSAHGTEVASRSARLALQVIAFAQDRQAILCTATDLAIATVVGLGASPEWTGHWLARRLVAVTATVAPTVLPALAGPAPPARLPGQGRWLAVEKRVRDGRGPVAQWAGYLASNRPDPDVALPCLHNQLGLSRRDECRVYCTLARSVRAAPRTRTRPGPRAAHTGTGPHCTAHQRAAD